MYTILSKKRLHETWKTDKNCNLHVKYIHTESLQWYIYVKHNGAPDPYSQCIVQVTHLFFRFCVYCRTLYYLLCSACCVPVL